MNAFPEAGYMRPDGNFEWPKDGMTLRDYFAAAAMQGFVEKVQKIETNWPQTAKLSYEAAAAAMEVFKKCAENLDRPEFSHGILITRFKGNYLVSAQRTSPATPAETLELAILPFRQETFLEMSRSQPQLKHKIEKPPNPNVLYSSNTEQFDAIIERSKAGEFRIFTLSRGKTNGAWIFGIGK